MALKTTRKFNCKNEELASVGRMVHQNLMRDKADISAAVPTINDSYVGKFGEQVQAVASMSDPKLLLGKQKAVTTHLRNTCDGLIPSLNRLGIYLGLAEGSIPLSAADFGIDGLRKSLRSYDTDGIARGINVLVANLTEYSAQLATVGYTDSISETFSAALTSIIEDSNQLFSIRNARLELTHSNTIMLNDLYEKVREVCKVAKSIYSETNHAKAKEYTLTYLTNQVRRSASTKPASTDVPNAPEAVKTE